MPAKRPQQPKGPPPPKGLRTRGNINLAKRPVVKNKDGSISTVRSMSANFGKGREVLMPTVMDNGTIVSDRAAIKNFKKTGKHLGVFDTPANADKFAAELHESQAKRYLPKKGK